MVKLPCSSSNNALFEEGRVTGGWRVGGKWQARLAGGGPGINEEVPFSRAGLLVTFCDRRNYFFLFLYL